jgi:hypothetical protein
MADKINVFEQNLSACRLENTKHYSDLSSEVINLKEKLIELSAKFDIWQSNTESMLGQSYNMAQTSMTYSTEVLCVIGFFITVGIIFVAVSKSVAIHQAKKELMREVINSKEFENLLGKVTAFVQDSNNAERERAVKNSAKINTSDINNAKGSPEEPNLN